MIPFFKAHLTHIWPPAVLIAADIVITVGTIPAELRYLAAWMVLGFLSGWVWLNLFLARPLPLAERLMLAVGLSLALTITTAMLTVYLPGPLTMSQLLLTTNGLIVVGWAIGLWQKRDGVESSSKTTVFILIALLIFTAALRLPRLGYAEFHEDEAEALMLGVRLFQGEDYALFLHRKGPAQMLLPVVFWLFTNRITEAMARFPFALSSILSVATLFLMGRRWFNWQAGVIAGVLWALHGYSISFGRMVQYQALIFFLGPLAIYSLYLAWKEHQSRLQIPAAILLATCLLAHFDALLLLPAAAYLVRQINRGLKWPRIITTPTLIALILFLILLASFYIPYLLDPEFSHTVTYLSESRVKPGLLYNNLNLLRRLDQDYSSHFYLPLLAFGIISLAIIQGLNFSKRWRWTAAGLGLLAVSTWLWPNIWQFDSLSLVFGPWLLLGLFFIWLVPDTAVKTAWLMFGVPFVGYVFLVDDPRTHLYILYPGATLLAGAGWAGLFGYLKNLSLTHRRPAKIFATIIAATGMVLTGLIIVYSIAIFLLHESTLNQLRRQWSGSMWKTLYNDLPDPRSYFGYPKREGWKTIGALRAQGAFPGDFRSVNEDFIIPIWYNYGQARSCYNTPAHFFVRPASDDIPSGSKGYSEAGRIQREDETRLYIFSANTEPQEIVYAVEDFIDTFDQLTTPNYFAQQDQPSQYLATTFGNAIKFEGYDLPAATVAPGDTLVLNLYWRALDTPTTDYRAFAHLTDGANLWAQQDDDPACRLPTSIWRAGQHGVGQFRLRINPETPPGRYPLVIGLYRADTLERLEITSGAGQPGDNFLWLQDIEVAR